MILSTQVETTYSLIYHSPAESSVNIPSVANGTQHVFVSESTKSNDGTQETVVVSYNAESDNLTGLVCRFI